MRTCSVKFCQFRSYQKSEKQLQLEGKLGEKIRFYTFPKTPELKKQWTKALRKWKPLFLPVPGSLLCHLHFTKDCFFQSCNIRKLRPGSIPTIFPTIESKTGLIHESRHWAKKTTMDSKLESKLAISQVTTVEQKWFESQETQEIQSNDVNNLNGPQPVKLPTLVTVPKLVSFSKPSPKNVSRPISYSSKPEPAPLNGLLMVYSPKPDPLASPVQPTNTSDPDPLKLSFGPPLVPPQQTHDPAVSHSSSDSAFLSNHPSDPLVPLSSPMLKVASNLLLFPPKPELVSPALPPLVLAPPSDPIVPLSSGPPTHKFASYLLHSPPSDPLPAPPPLIPAPSRPLPDSHSPEPPKLKVASNLFLFPPKVDPCSVPIPPTSIPVTPNIRPVLISLPRKPGPFSSKAVSGSVWLLKTPVPHSGSFSSKKVFNRVPPVPLNQGKPKNLLSESERAKKIEEEIAKYKEEEELRCDILQQKLRRNLKTIECLKAEIADLKKKIESNKTIFYLESNKAIDVSFKDVKGVCPSLFKLCLKKNEGHREKEFDPKLKEFARVLYNCSPKAYHYVRRQLDFCLPHKNTVRRWKETAKVNNGVLAVDIVQSEREHEDDDSEGQVPIDEEHVIKVEECLKEDEETISDDNG